MIFSSDKCPICNLQLDLEIKEDKILKKVSFNYTCKTTELSRNDAHTAAIPKSHYESQFYQGEDYSKMIFKDYLLAHFQSMGITRVFTNSTTKPNEFIFDIPLLDADYSQPHVICARLKRLVPFS